MTKHAIIALDFDGVLHSAPNGYTGMEPEGDPVAGALDFVKAEIAKGTELVIYTARAAISGAAAVVAVDTWLRKHGFPYIPVVGNKPHADLYVDDRGYRFEGDFSALTDYLAENPVPSRWEKKA
ncbi:MAG: hypothetical protein V3S71_02820 [Acidobacteriota bacterium]